MNQQEVDRYRSPAQYANLLRLRCARQEDERIRYSLGLTRYCLRYGPYGQDPNWIWIGTDGQLYQQVHIGQYKKVRCLVSLKFTGKQVVGPPRAVASIESEGIRVALVTHPDGTTTGTVCQKGDTHVLFLEHMEDIESGLDWFDEAMNKLGDGQFHSYIRLSTTLAPELH